MSDTPAVIRERAEAVREAGSALRASTTSERADWLAAAARLLDQACLTAGDALSKSSGLSHPMVQWAARTTLETVTVDALLRVAHDARRENPEASPIEMLSVLLAGNLFTAPVRGIFVPLLLGVPVLVKASSRETVFPELLKNALRRADASLGAAVDLVVFPGGDLDCEQALLENAEAAAVYASDETVASLSKRASGTALIAHGHGVSAAYCGGTALEPAQLSETVASLALDVCAYDQRGCLSPQFVYLEETPHCSAEAFAERLASDGLEPLNAMLPRGPLPLSVGASQAQWRGVAEVEGTLVQGESYSIAVRRAEPLRWSPGYRNLSVALVEGPAQAIRALTSCGSNLKSVGGDPGSLGELHALLTASSALDASACPLGGMQTPALDAPADGRPVWYGLMRG